jgi:hypothetical protein
MEIDHENNYTLMRTVACKSVISNVATMRDFQITSNKFNICISYHNECGRTGLLTVSRFLKEISSIPSSALFGTVSLFKNTFV